MEKFFLAIDGGSSSVRAILFNVNGEQIHVEQESWTHNVDPDIPGSMGFDYGNNWNIICKLIKNLILNSEIDPESISGIATTTMREGFVLYDSEMNELIGFANVDSRAINESEFLKKEYPELEKKLFGISGESFALGALPRLLWVKRNRPDLSNKARYMNMLNDWITFKLTGKLVSEPSNSSTTGLFNLVEKKWDFSELKNFDIELTPVEVLESGEFVSNVSSEAATATGLSKNTKVIMGGGDAQLGCIGIGSFEKGDTSLLGGTFWQLNYNLNEIKDDIDEHIRLNCHAIENLWQIELIAWQVGNTIDWFTESFLDKETSFFKNKSMFYDYLNNEILNVPPGSNGIISTFSNEMNMMKLYNCAPTFTNFSLSSDLSNKFSFYRSILESTGYVVKKHKNRIENESSSTIKKIRFAGGASNNPIWCQILADILEVEIEVPVIKEATALGAAMLAAIGSNSITSEEAKNWVTIETTYYPNKDNFEIYRKQSELWKKIYEHQLCLVDDGITNSMWKAPGI